MIGRNLAAVGEPLTRDCDEHNAAALPRSESHMDGRSTVMRKRLEQRLGGENAACLVVAVGGAGCGMCSRASVDRSLMAVRYRARRSVDTQGVNAVSVGGARRTEILDTAAALFASSGLQTSLKEIADACGILPGSLYHHFESKEALVVELVERYQADLDAIADEAVAALHEGDETIDERIVSLGIAIAACAVRHRAALLLTLYEPPSAAGNDLVRAVQRSPLAIEKAMLDTFVVGQERGYLRSGIDLETMADRLCQVLLHVSLGVFKDVSGADEVPALRCRALLDGIAVDPPSNAALDRSAAFDAASRTIESWANVDNEEDERLPMLRSVARGGVRSARLRGNDGARHRVGFGPEYGHRVPVGRIEGRVARIDHAVVHGHRALWVERGDAVRCNCG